MITKSDRVNNVVTAITKAKTPRDGRQQDDQITMTENKSKIKLCIQQHVTTYPWPERGRLSVHVFGPERHAGLSERGGRRHGQIVVIGL